MEYEKMKKVLASVMLIALVSTVNAENYHFFDAERLLQVAQEWEKYQESPKDADAYLVAEYAGYVGAVFDQEETGVISICVAERTTKNDILNAVSDFIINTNTQLDIIAPEIIEDALYWEYACSK